MLSNTIQSCMGERNMPLSTADVCMRTKGRLMDNWDEIRTAFQVARMGTVSGAADVLGVHHATVIRHIDSLEGRLGAKLFQRHARGYTPTEAGMDLMQVAQATDDQLTQLSGRIKGRGDDVSGELVITTLSGISGLLMPALTEFQSQNPKIVMRFLTGERLFRLEYGEAHVAIRLGTAPDQPDNVVQPFVPQNFALYACPKYIEAHGMPENVEDFVNHNFVTHDNKDIRAPFHRWLRQNVPEERIVFTAIDETILQEAILNGVGIGFLPVWEAARFPDLVQVKAPLPEWAVSTWLVTHVDLHRTPKVQAFLKYIKDAAKTWEHV